MKRKLVFWTAFNSYHSEKLLRGKPPGTIHPAFTKKWNLDRIRLFQKFNLPCILGQTYDDFLYIVLLHPSSKPMIDTLLPKIDDRVVYAYEDGEALEQIKKYDEIVYALIDSDDMYSCKAGEIMMRPHNSEWMYFKHGYAYQPANKKLWEYDTIGSGPFFAHRFNPKNMNMFDREKRHPTHKAVINLNPQELPPGNFCVLLHNINTSSKVEMRYVLKHHPQPISILKEKFSL